MSFGIALNVFQANNRDTCPAGIYFCKVNKENTKIVSNLFNIFDIVLSYFNANFEQISHIVLVFPLLNLNK